MNVDAYALFRNNVIEIPFKYWESPPGMGLCPLDVAFTVCSSISSWLTLNEDHFVVRDPPLPSCNACMNGECRGTCPRCGPRPLQSLQHRGLPSTS